MSKTNKVDGLLDFLNSSPTAWHAIEGISQELKKAGFEELPETEKWELKPSSSYYVIRNGSSLCAFQTPSKAPVEAHIAAGHTDSPGFKLKPKAEFRKENMIMLGLEVYGGPLLTSWLNRDCGIAGRVSYLDKEGEIRESLVRIDDYPVVIPQLAIHQDRQVNESGLLLNKQEHLAAIAGLVIQKEGCESHLEKCLSAKIPFKKLLGSDLFLFPLEPAALIGSKKELVASYRIDSLLSVHAIAQAFAKGKPSTGEILKVACFSDNEEIGSETAQGAGSPFLSHVLERVLLSFEKNREDYFRLLSKSVCLSVDLAHAFHPNYPERQEPRHPILMNHGIAVKFNAQQRYASDARSASVVMALCHKHGIPVQEFVTRGDIACGSTIGPIHAHVTGISTVDIGCPQLSMHSCREISGVEDYHSMKKLLEAFYKN